MHLLRSPLSIPYSGVQRSGTVDTSEHVTQRVSNHRWSKYIVVFINLMLLLAGPSGAIALRILS